MAQRNNSVTRNKHHERTIMKKRDLISYLNRIAQCYEKAKKESIEDKNYVIDVEIFAQILMSRGIYRGHLELYFPELYKELEETNFLYIKRD